MRPSFSLFLAGLAAAPLMLLSSAALAGPSGAAACGNIALVANTPCSYEISGCSADCTPPNLVAACSGECTADPDVSCTGGCQTSCEAQCNVDPGSFMCTGSCEESCDASCASDCTDSACQNDCQLTCSNQCQVSCEATAPSASCSAQCETSCNASCTVEANIDCHAKCSIDLQGGCNVSCSDPTGALFCDGQYVDLGSDPDACLAYLASQGFEVAVTCDTDGCSVTSPLAGACSAAPGLASTRDPLGIAGIAGMMIGLGLVASRRRKRA